MDAILSAIRPGLFEELFAWSLVEGWGDDRYRTAEICRQLHLSQGADPDKVRLDMFVHEPQFSKPQDEQRRREREIRAVEAQIDARLGKR